MFGSVQGEFKKPENLTTIFAKIPPISKITKSSQNDISDLSKMCIKKEGILSKPFKMLISSFTVHNGTMVAPLLWFHL